MNTIVQRLLISTVLAVAIATTARAQNANQVLEWNQIFIDTLIATNTTNSSSQRLGAIVHTAIFDAYNGVERRYTPIFVNDVAPPGASRRAAVISAAYTALVGLFPASKTALDAGYQASLAALSEMVEMAVNPVSAALLGELTWLRRCLRGARPMDSRELSAIPGWICGWAVASNTSGIWTNECPGFGIHSDVCFGQQHSVPAWSTPRSKHYNVHRRLQRS